MTGRNHFPYRYGSYVKNKNELKALLLQSQSEITRPNTHEWCLYVGELKWDNFAEVQPLLKAEPLINKHLNTVRQCLSTLEVSDEINKGFQGTAWSQSLKPLYSFMVSNRIIKWHLRTC